MELVKTGPIVDKPVEEMTTAELWAVFFEYLTDPEKRDKIIEIINQEEGIAMAVQTLGAFTQDEIEYARLNNLIKSELDWRSGLAEARNEGLEEGFTEGLAKGHDVGLAEGRNEANLENAQKMKTMGFLAEQIQAVTGLPIETISRL